MDVFPLSVKKAFVKLGDDQRGTPEKCMLDVQFMMGGGVLNPVVEHVGDITHRMTHLVQYTPTDRLPTSGELGFHMVDDKVHKTYKWLNSSYGFEREFEQNIINNFEYYKEKGKFKNQTVKDYRNKIAYLLKKYAEAHERLVVYNHAQWKARQAAVAVGYMAWDSASSYLASLKLICKDEETYIKECSSFRLNPSGNPIPYK